MAETHISVDLETAGSAPGSAIMSIGATAYPGYQTFQRYVYDPTGSWSPDTFRWLALQDNALAIVGTSSEAYPLGSALDDFRVWLTDLNALVEGEAHIWTHATFDMPILEMAYVRAGIVRPWHYRNCRDLRTLYYLAGGRPEVTNPGEHDALSDAQVQLEEARLCLEKLGRPLNG